MFQLNLPMSPILPKHRCVFQRSSSTQKYDIEPSAPNSSLQTKTRNALNHLHLLVTMASSKLSIQISWAMTGELLDTIVVRADETVGKLKENHSFLCLGGTKLQIIQNIVCFVERMPTQKSTLSIRICSLFSAFKSSQSSHNLLLFQNEGEEKTVCKIFLFTPKLGIPYFWWRLFSSN